MSGNTCGIRKGIKVKHKNITKTVKDYYFISDGGCHNSDIIVMVFTDGTDTGETGFRNIRIISAKCSKCKGEGGYKEKPIDKFDIMCQKCEGTGYLV